MLRTPPSLRSTALVATALAALLAWTRPRPEPAAEAHGVEIVWDEAADEGVGQAADGMPPSMPPSPAAPPAPFPPPPAMPPLPQPPRLVGLQVRHQGSNDGF